MFPESLELISDVVYAQVGQKKLLLDILRPKVRSEKPVPAIVFIHGGGWHMFEKYAPANIFLAEAGFVTVAINYRLSHEAKFPAQLEDAIAAIDWLRNNAGELVINADFIGAWGISAGGHLAALLGVHNKVQAVVDVCGPSDFFDPSWQLELSDPDGALSRLLGGVVSEKPELAKQASPALQINQATCPFLIIHGQNDTLVPLSQAQRLHKQLGEKGTHSELVVFPDGDHFINETHQAQMEQQILDFFRMLAKR